jgi:hypothetical protein
MISSAKNIIESEGGECHLIAIPVTEEQNNGAFDQSRENIEDYIKTAESYFDKNPQILDKVADSVVGVIVS